MRLSRLIAVAAVPAVALVAAARPSIRIPRDPAGDHVRRHLDSVLVELRHHGVRTLAPVQRVRRQRLIAELATYRNRGDFPHNYDFPGRLVPYFRDRETGALCAVGDLLAYTGRSDIVDRVVRLDNNVRVPQLSADTAFRAWLDENGLTLAEAARIQVVYVHSVSPAQEVGTIAVGTLAPLSGMAAIATTVTNLWANRDGSSTAATTLGFLSGALSVAAGVALLHSPGLPGWMGASTTGLGALALGTSARSLGHHRALVNAEAARRGRVAEVSVAPVVDVAPARGVRPAVGASVALRF